MASKPAQVWLNRLTNLGSIRQRLIIEPNQAQIPTHGKLMAAKRTVYRAISVIENTVGRHVEIATLAIIQDFGLINWKKAAPMKLIGCDAPAAWIASVFPKIFQDK